jgi:hypothetical protein
MRIQKRFFSKTENPKIKLMEALRKIEKLGFLDFIRIVPIPITTISLCKS